MGGRLLLGIGSQCDGLPRLSFLPGVAEEVSEVLLDPRIGDCAPATADGRALLVDPTFVELDDAVTTAFQRASEEEATLFVSVIGHGEYNTDDFYLMAKDSSYPPSSRNAFHLAQRMKELLTHYSMLDGLVLLLDTCHAGIGAEQAARRWVKIVGQAGRRFEVLTASDERTAADGCFSRTLARVLRSGVDRFGERL
ncbi:MAG: FHA domain-containing protein, partial [Sciscionella sp.]